MLDGLMKRKMFFGTAIVILLVIASVLPAMVGVSFSLTVDNDGGSRIFLFCFWGFCMLLISTFITACAAGLSFFLKALFLKNNSTNIEVDILWSAFSVAIYGVLLFGSKPGSIIRQCLPAIPILVFLVPLAYSLWRARYMK